MNWTRMAWAAIALLVTLRLGWEAGQGVAWTASVASALWPWLPLIVALAFRLRGALIYAGIGAWLCFSHGVMEAYASSAARGWAMAEILLSLIYFLALWLRWRQQEARH